jgi:hypothetical protein
LSMRAEKGLVADMGGGIEGADAVLSRADFGVWCGFLEFLRFLLVWIGFRE